MLARTLFTAASFTASRSVASRAAVAGPVAMQHASILPALPELATRSRTAALLGVRMQSTGPDRTVVEKCTQKIKDALQVKEIEVKGSYDDPNGSHVTIYCVAEEFEGKRSLARQQMVFKAIWEEMQGPVHAVDTMVLKAPSEL